MMQQNFQIQSFESTQTVAQDMDQGVIRVGGAQLKNLGGRNALVKVTVIDKGRAKASIVRIVRAATGAGALTSGQVAMQYDDRLSLGIQNASGEVELRIEPVHEWLGLPRFLLGHSSPLVRREALFGFSLMIVGAGIGFLLGLAVSFLPVASAAN